MAAIEMPPYLNSRVFRLSQAQQLSPTGTSGFIQTISRSEPFWRAEFATPGLSGSKYNEMVTFLDDLEGAIGTFLAYDPRRPMPHAYRDQPVSATPWGSPTVTGYNYANSTLQCANFTVGAEITKGDYISFQHGIIWYLFRIQQDFTVGAGGAPLLTVKPRPFVVGAINVPIRYQKACCEMKMLDLYEERDDVEAIGPSFSFRGTQYIARAPT